MSQTIQISGKDITITRLPLKKYVDLLKSIKSLPSHLSSLGGLDNSEVVSKLPTVIAEAYPDIVAIIEIATPLKKEEIEEMGLDELVDVLKAIAEVNRFGKIMDAVKKVTALPVNK